MGGELGGAAYVDRDNSLLASVALTRPAHQRLQVNLFPGVLPGFAHPVGLWAVNGRDESSTMGIAARTTPGLGVGHDFILER